MRAETSETHSYHLQVYNQIDKFEAEGGMGRGVDGEKAMVECKDLKSFEGLEASEPHGYHL